MIASRTSLLASLFVLPLLLPLESKGQTITRIVDVLDMDGREAETNPRPVQVKGVVLGMSTMFNFFALHDGTGAVGVFRRQQRDLKQGDLVEVTGLTMASTFQGNAYPRIQSDMVEIVGAGELPAAKSITFRTFASPENYDQWVNIEGYVMEWHYRSPDLRIKLVTPDGPLEAYVVLPEREVLPEKLHGARLRLTGTIVSIPAPGRVMFVPGLKQLEVLESGTKGVFEAPEAAMRDVTGRKLEQGRRWRVKGVIAAETHHRKTIIAGPDGAMMVHLLEPRMEDEPGTIHGDAGRWPALQPGDEVEFVGSSVNASDLDSQGCGLMWCHARVTGHQESPRPETAKLETIKSYLNEDHWVSFEATVNAWSLQAGHMLYAVAGPDADLILSVEQSPSDVFPKNLHGARMRFTGLTASRTREATGISVIVPGPAFAEVIKPGREDPFDAPGRSVGDIIQNKIQPGEHVKTKGLVVGRSGNALYLRGDGGALCANLQIPWQRSNDGKGWLYMDCGPVPDFASGDEVEVMGIPIRNASLPEYAPFDLVSANVRLTGGKHKVEPVNAALSSVSQGMHTSDFVEVRGRLLTLQQVPMDRGEWRTTMLLEADGSKLPATLQGPGRAGFETLKLDDDVLVKGLVNRANTREPRQLWLLSPADVKSLGISSVVRTRQFWMWGGGALAVIALFSGWVVALRKSNRVKSEVAALLEKRVNERTSELSRAQADLHRALEQERELNDLKSRFVTMVSHEFRTPLGIIMSATELMRHYDDRLPPDQRRELCDDIHSSTRLMASLMEQVLVLGRVEAGKLGCRRASCDIDTLVGKLVDEVHSATNRRCIVHWRAKNDLAGAQADESLIRHILTNLMTNAVKYSPEGRDVEITGERVGDDVVFQVIDHGIGIPPDDMKRLFEAFHRGTNVGEIPGTGLGLVIVKRCTDLHDGRIEVDSEPGRGTTFTVRIPVYAS